MNDLGWLVFAVVLAVSGLWLTRWALRRAVERGVADGFARHDRNTDA